MSKMRLGMHEVKWDIWNGTRTWSQTQAVTQHSTQDMGSSTRRDTTQHTGMGSSTRHDTAQHTGHGVKHKA